MCPRTAAIALLLLALGASGCATMGGAGRATMPTRYEREAGPFTVFTNAPLEADAPAIRQLQALGRQLEATLGVRVDPRATPVEVYILDDREAFTRFLKENYPSFPPRRAFFLAQGGRRVVYTHLGDRLEEDLRHEATHALLHAAIGDVPLWLDEGLAEYFEGPRGDGGLNAEHLGRLPRDLAAGWSPDLPRLEGLKDVCAMTPRDYRESWAWVHYLLDGPDAGRAALLAYLADLRTSPAPAPLSTRIDGAPGPRLLAHLERLRTNAVAAAERPPTVRLQSDPVEPPTPEPPRRRSVLGWFGRLFAGRDDRGFKP